MGTRALEGAVETMPGLVVRPGPVAGASAMPASLGDEFEMVRMGALLKMEEVARKGRRADVGLAVQPVSRRLDRCVAMSIPRNATALDRAMDCILGSWKERDSVRGRVACCVTLKTQSVAGIRA